MDLDSKFDYSLLEYELKETKQFLFVLIKVSLTENVYAEMKGF